MRSSSKWLLVMSMIVAAGTAACLTSEAPSSEDTEAISRAPVPGGDQVLTNCKDPANPGHDNWVDCCGDGVCYPPNICGHISCGTSSPAEQPLGCGGPDSGLVDCCGDGYCIAPEVCRFTNCAS